MIRVFSGGGLVNIRLENLPLASSSWVSSKLIDGENGKKGTIIVFIRCCSLCLCEQIKLLLVFRKLARRVVHRVTQDSCWHWCQFTFLLATLHPMGIYFWSTADSFNLHNIPKSNMQNTSHIKPFKEIISQLFSSDILYPSVIMHVCAPCVSVYVCKRVNEICIKSKECCMRAHLCLHVSRAQL